MEFWTALLAEAKGERTLYVIVVVLALSALLRVRAPEESGRVRASLLLLALYLLLLPASALLRMSRHGAHDELHLVLLLVEALTVIGLACSTLFAVVLPRLHLDAPRILRDVVVTGVSIVAAFLIASRSGFNISGIVATSTVLTAVIGLSLQDTLGNVMAGLTLQLDRSVHVGDWVRIGDISGRVTETRWRSTSVETRNWETLVVPNSVLVKNSFLVLGRRIGQPPLWRRSVFFNVDYRYPPNEVIAAVDEVLSASSIPHVSGEPKPQCVLMDFTESYGRYSVRYWLTDFGLDDPTDSLVRTRVYLALKRAGIPLSIPAQALFVTENSEERDLQKTEGDQRRRVEAIGRVELFQELSEAERLRLAVGLRYSPFARGEVVTRQGADAYWLYLLTKGEATVTIRGEGDLEREVARLRAGSFFGEMSLLTGAPRSATVTAVTDLECYRLDKGVFQDVLRSAPKIAEQVAEVLARRAGGLDSVRQDLDEEAHRRQVAVARNDILARIRHFFGVGEGGGH